MPTTPAPLASFAKLLRDSWLIFQRQILLVVRNPVWVVIGIVQPLYFLFLFGPLLKNFPILALILIDRILEVER